VVARVSMVGALVLLLLLLLLSALLPLLLHCLCLMCFGGR
jgi:hypothetical protein